MASGLVLSEEFTQIYYAAITVLFHKNTKINEYPVQDSYNNYYVFALWYQALDKLSFQLTKGGIFLWSLVESLNSRGTLPLPTEYFMRVIITKTFRVNNSCYYSMFLAVNDSSHHKHRSCKHRMNHFTGVTFS